MCSSLPKDCLLFPIMCLHNLNYSIMSMVLNLALSKLIFVFCHCNMCVSHRIFKCFSQKAELGLLRFPCALECVSVLFGSGMQTGLCEEETVRNARAFFKVFFPFFMAGWRWNNDSNVNTK